MNHLKPYLAYKSSGEPWLGEIPLNWQSHRLCQLSSIRSEKNRPELNLLSVFLGRGVIPYGDGNGQVHKPSLDLANYQVVYQGDFVLNNQQAWRGSVGVSSHFGIISPAYVVLKLNSLLNPQYSNYLFQSQIMVAQFVVACKGVGDIQRDLYYPWLRKVIVPVPPLHEQNAIVRYLDYMDRRIRRYIKAKKKLIVLLNEQKQAIIHQAVTRGLDPNIRLKPSGVEWLGDIPEHWEVRRIKSLSLVKRGASPRPIANAKYFDEKGEYAWVRIEDVTASERYLEKTTQHLSELGKSLSVPLQPGFLFLSIAGSVGKPIITNIKCCIHDGFVYFPKFKGNSEFLWRVLSLSVIYSRLGKLGTQLNLNTSTVGDIKIGWPPINEQIRIVEFCDRATKHIVWAIERTKNQINLIQEYHTRLIADVVTGKLDVREAAANLQEEVEEKLIEEIEIPDENIDDEEHEEITEIADDE